MACTYSRAERAAGFVDVATRHASVELDTLIENMLLEPVVRHAEPELLH
jgi:hypothetical protein